MTGSRGLSGRTLTHASVAHVNRIVVHKTTTAPQHESAKEKKSLHSARMIFGSSRLLPIEAPAQLARSSLSRGFVLQPGPWDYLIGWKSSSGIGASKSSRKRVA